MASIINASNSGFGGIVSTGDSSGVLQLQAAGTTVTTIASTGMTVTGTLSSSGVSTFAAGTAALPAITTTGDTNTGMFFPAADTIAFAEGGTEAMRLDSSGNVGIGTTSGAAGLNVYKYGSTWTGAGASTYPYPAGNVFLQVGGVASQNNWIGITGNYNTSTGSANILLQANLQDTNNQAGNYIGSEATAIGQAALTFGRMIGAATVGGNAAKSEAMRIDSSGKLIMASVADGTLGTIQAGITANTGSTNAIISVAANANGAYPFGARGESTNQGLVGFFNSSNTAIASITKSGNSVAYNTSSDYRLKENIIPMTGALNKVAQLKPVTYTWKEDGSSGQGFIAHELQEVISDAVFGEKDAVDKDGNIKPQGVDTSFLVATLTAAIQEQQTIINDLKARIETLEAK